MSGCNPKIQKIMAYAVFTSGNKQYRVTVGDVLTVDRISGLENDGETTFDQVLLVEDGDATKVGTPTMGGLMIIGLIMLTSILFLDMGDPKLQCCLLVMGVTAILGFLDDWAKITKKSTDGVSGWFKIALQAVAAIACAGYLYYLDPAIARVLVPFYGMLDLGIFFIPFAMLVIIGASNAVNLTDGLDGLASGCMVISALAFIIISSFVLFPGTGNSPLVCYLLCIASACLGFL